MTEGSGNAQKNWRRKKGWKWEQHGPYSSFTVYPGLGFLWRIRLCQWKILLIASYPSLPEDLPATALPVHFLQCHSRHTLTYKHIHIQPLLVHRENKTSRLEKASLFCQQIYKPSCPLPLVSYYSSGNNPPSVTAPTSPTVSLEPHTIHCFLFLVLFISFNRMLPTSI